MKSNATEAWKAAEKESNPMASGFERAARIVTLPPYKTEYKFAPDRKFLADYAWPKQRLIVEVEGGIFGTGKPCPTCKHRKGGAHGSIKGILRDIEKYNLATSMGFVIFRFGPEQAKNPLPFALMIREQLNG